MIKQIASLQHPIVKHLVRVRQNRSYREDHQSVLLEGKKLVSEVCGSHPTKRILVCDIHLIPSGVTADEILLVTPAIIEKISGTSSPEEIVAEVAMPPTAILSGMRYILVCDGIQDPGNLGTLLRSALALGWQGAFLLSNSCDPFNDKAIRAAKGATFRLPLAWGTWEDLQKLIQDNKLHVLVADIEGELPDSIATHDGLLLILSNESTGVTSKAQEIGQAISIPMSGKMESLNVAAAGAILMYTLKQGNHEKA